MIQGNVYVKEIFAFGRAILFLWKSLYNIFNYFW